MSEKRFTYDKPLVAFSKGGINDNVTGETYEFTMDTVLDLLNQLHQENEHLIIGNKNLMKKNEQLKKENRVLKKDLNKLYNLLMDKGMSHNELQDVLWGIDDERARIEN